MFGITWDMFDYEYLVGIKSGECGVVIGYQVDEFTCVLVSKCYVAQSQIFTGSQAKYDV